MILFGWGFQTIKQFGVAFKNLCGHCHNEEYWILARTMTWFTLFFIPIFPYKVDYRLSCPICQYGLSLNREQINDIKPLAIANQLLIDGEITNEEHQLRLNQINSKPEQIETETQEIKELSVNDNNLSYCTGCGNEIKDNHKFCTSCGDVKHDKDTVKIKSKLATKKNIIISWIALFFIIILIVIYIFFQNSKRSISNKDQKNQDIASAVVNIYCMGKTKKDSTGGSGTILTEDGLILTNAHIIPDGAEKTVSCLVILPDPSTGSPNEMYTAYPIIVPNLSEKYDIAFIQVDDVYYDEKKGKAYGVYPKKFPAYENSSYCKNKKLKLGEPVRIYGYPAISGGYALTITDGIVSSMLPDEGLIVTSAKISHGNSGGLAVDENGCRIGIPSMVSGDDYESLGVIISNDMIYKFTDELQTLYNK